MTKKTQKPPAEPEGSLRGRIASEPKPRPTRPTVGPTPTPSVAGSVNRRNLWQSWMMLSPRTRLKFSLAICAFSGAGILVSDVLGWAYPVEQDSTQNQKPSPASS
ncbi:hypothetical protein NEOLEDRAFT_35926 [Neolentinus lepideus HHB14362 ss-1]|uniref:Uncharacterized protein n=1 Tax=Neolentinus lepideus HHB14362 ss-1 TaxID=1314782 RepID=A0A165W7E7_9AGAM|nr:hypothetical protein NEOLEDRAFT_35926 [Neolentinus lepideus HHB14362 ss-1]